MQVLVVITTAATKEDAARLARLTVEERLAACAQLYAIESVYRWEGIQQEAEWRVELKTSSGKCDALMARLAEAHPYDEPELIALPAERSSAGYAAWVAAETA